VVSLPPQVGAAVGRVVGAAVGRVVGAVVGRVVGAVVGMRVQDRPSEPSLYPLLQVQL
jgi:outer membrane lipoprotein SlyB